MIYNTKPVTFAVIGKPNNGKSSIISALTNDDRIKIADEIGTTKEIVKYSYKYKNEEVCCFYDTPGFENAKKVLSHIKYKKNEIPSIKSTLEDFIKVFLDNKSTNKDREILKAIINSDYIAFVIDISDKFNKNIIGYELDILKELTQPIIILFNQRDKNKDYSLQWEENLKQYDFTNIHRINPLNSIRTNIIHILKSLYSPDSQMFNKDQMIKNVIETYNIDYEEKLNETAKKIAHYLKDALQIKITTTRKKLEENESYVIELIQKEINKTEKKIQNELSKLWGYHEVNVQDKRERYNHKVNKKIALSKKEKAVIAAIIGASSGWSLDFFIGVPGSGALIGGAGGYITGYFSDGKLYEINTKNATISTSKKDIDLSIILVTRILEFTKTIITHGHANRTAVTVDKIEKINFSKSELKVIASTHKSFVLDKNVYKNIPKLEDLIINILSKEFNQHYIQV